MKKSGKNIKKIRSKNLIAMIVGVLLLVLVVVGLVFGIQKFIEKREYRPYYSIEERSEKIKQTTVADSQAYAWLRVQGTNIDTPVVKITTAINEDVKANYLWTSSEYVEGQNRKVIYGHNIRNVSSYPDKVNPDHFRFEQLVSFAYYDFAKENLYIQYNDGKEEALYKIYAVSFNNSGDEYGQSYEQGDVPYYIETALKNSVYDYDVDVKEDDELIALVTCTRYFGAFEKTQFRVDARRVRKNEKVEKYDVQTNSNYEVIK